MTAEGKERRAGSDSEEWRRGLEERARELELLDAKVEDIGIGRAHVFLLGAGASRAALPNGDRQGRQLPLMDDLVTTVGLAELLDSNGIQHEGRDFEAVYGLLSTSERYADLAAEVEACVREYFARLMLPSEPTIYDYLVLSLREKDLIATVNWDPLLVQAAQRNSHRAPMPEIVYLHGNVAIGYCFNHEPPVMHFSGRSCETCGEVVTDSPLLFPVEEKGYRDDQFIARCWESLEHHLKGANIFTVFGYSSPTSDREAKDLLMSAWGGQGDRPIEQMEIIDIRDAEQLQESWEPFLHAHHSVHDEFDNSLAARHPRRSCEALWAATMLLRPYPDNPLPPDVGLEALWAQVSLSVQREMRDDSGDTPL